MIVKTNYRVLDQARIIFNWVIIYYIQAIARGRKEVDCRGMIHECRVCRYGEVEAAPPAGWGYDGQFPSSEMYLLGKLCDSRVGGGWDQSEGMMRKQGVGSDGKFYFASASLVGIYSATILFASLLTSALSPSWLAWWFHFNSFGSVAKWMARWSRHFCVRYVFGHRHLADGHADFLCYFCWYGRFYH